MNLGTDFRNVTLEGLRGVFENWWARINTIWKKEHDPETGGHTDVTANSVTADVVTVTDELDVVPATVSEQQLLGLGSLLSAVRQGDGLRRIDVSARDTSVPFQVTSTVVGSTSTVFAIALAGRANPAPTNNSASGLLVSSLFSEASGGTHPLLASLHVLQPSVVSGAAAVTDTATVYIPAASSATVVGANYAIWVDAGTSRFDGLINAVGGQIQFPATQASSADANTLDDYEEGAVNGTSPNITYTSCAFNYQKVGNWVQITGFVVFPATADANQAAINNLPFTCENSSQARGGCACQFSNSGVVVGLVVANNTTTVQFFNAATGAALTNAALTGTTQFFDFSYRATA